MIRLRRILRYGISAGGLLICLATAAMWARSRTVAIQNILLARLNGRVWEFSCTAQEHFGRVRISTVDAFPHPAIAENFHLTDRGRFLTPGGRAHMIYVGIRNFEFSHAGIDYTGFSIDRIRAAFAEYGEGGGSVRI